MTEYISRQQAQRMLGCDKATIIKLLLSGDIKSSRKENGGWLVSRASLEKYMEKKAEKDFKIMELHRILAEYKRENKILMELLKENGISYESAVADKAPRVKMKISIADLNLSNRALHSLYLNNIRSIKQLRGMSLEDMIKLQGVGKKTAMEIITQLMSNGIEPEA